MHPVLALSDAISPRPSLTNEMMKLVYLDAFALNPGDLDLSPLTALCDATIYDRTPAELVMQRCADAHIILTNKIRFTANVMDQLPHLKAVMVSATGYDGIDTQAARERGITVCNVPRYGTASVAQHTIGLLLALTNRIEAAAQHAQSGGWSQNPDWCYFLHPTIELAGKTMGIIGMGEIGQQVARIAQSLGMHILAHSRTPKAILNVTWADYTTVFEQSDVVSLHCPLTPENTQLVRMERLSRMKPTAFLLNTARGKLIHEQELADALNRGVIAGAGLDVLTEEPPPPDHPLLHARNTIITPHASWGAREARQRLLDILTENVASFLRGTPQNVVNPA